MRCRPPPPDTSTLTRRDLLRLGAAIGGVFAVSALGVHLNPVEEALAAVDITLDDEVSVYAGGNLTITALMESEGVMVVDGNLVDNDPGNPHLYAGAVVWGMMLPPSAACTMLAVGGQAIFNILPWHAYVSGNAQIGGLCAGTTQSQYGGLGCGPSTAEGLYVAAPGSKGPHDLRWEVANNGGCRVRAGLGKQAALRGVGNSGKAIDYNDYWNRAVAPLVSRLRALPATGSWSMSALGTYSQLVMKKVDHNSRDTTLTSGYDAKLSIRGDGRSPMQVIDVDWGQVASQMSALGKSQVSMSFENMPESEDSTILVRVHGTNPTVRSGFKTWINGRDVSTYVNAPTSDATFTAYRTLSSRVCYLFDDNVGSVFVDCAHGMRDGVDIYQPGTGRIDLNLVTGKCPVCGNLLAGSLIIPGSSHVKGSTNGKLFVRGDLTLNTWEHHNVVWRGLRTGFAKLEKSARQSAWL